MEKNISWAEMLAIQQKYSLTLSIEVRPDGYFLSMPSSGMMYTCYLPIPTVEGPASSLPVTHAADVASFEALFVTPAPVVVDTNNNIGNMNSFSLDTEIVPVGSTPVSVAIKGVSNRSGSHTYYVIEAGKKLTIQSISSSSDSCGGVSSEMTVSICDDGTSPSLELSRSINGSSNQEFVTVDGDGIRSVMLHKKTLSRGLRQSEISVKGYVQ